MNHQFRLLRPRGGVEAGAPGWYVGADVVMVTDTARAGAEMVSGAEMVDGAKWLASRRAGVPKEIETPGKTEAPTWSSRTATSWESVPAPKQPVQTLWRPPEQGPAAEASQERRTQEL